MKGTGNLSVLFPKLACSQRHGLVHSVKLKVWDSVESRAYTHEREQDLGSNPDTEWQQLGNLF